MKNILPSKLLVKRILDTLCAIALSAVDFVLNTQNGDTWSTAVNAMGIVMLVIIAGQYPVRKLLTPVTAIVASSVSPERCEITAV